LAVEPDPFKISDKGRLLRQYLGMLEVYAVGIETELFDFDRAKALSGGFIRRQLERYSHYIAAENERTEGRAYAALLQLEKKLSEEPVNDHADNATSDRRISAFPS
jgi:hypothetical protein